MTKGAASTKPSAAAPELIGGIELNRPTILPYRRGSLRVTVSLLKHLCMSSHDIAKEMKFLFLVA